MKWILRSANFEDAEAIATLEGECFSDPWSREAVAQTLLSPTAYAVTAWTVDREGKDECVGYLLFLAVAPEAEIARIGVASRFRKQGIGTALMAEGLRLMREGGCDSFFLEVREHNLAAQALYLAHGFRTVGRRKHYYKEPCEDALMMALLPELSQSLR